MEQTTDTREGNANHIHTIRRAIMGFLALYVQQHDDIDDAAVIGAIGAVLCKILVIRGNELDDDVLHVLRETYKLVQIEQAMQEKEEETSH